MDMLVAPAGRLPWLGMGTAWGTWLVALTPAPPPATPAPCPHDSHPRRLHPAQVAPSQSTGWNSPQKSFLGQAPLPPERPGALPSVTCSVTLSPGPGSLQHHRCVDFVYNRLRLHCYGHSSDLSLARSAPPGCCRVPTAAWSVATPAPPSASCAPWGPFMRPSELCTWEASRPGAPARACSSCSPRPWAPPSKSTHSVHERNGSGCLLGAR